MVFLNYAIWLITFVLLLTWTVGSIFKPKQMGGQESWGTTNFKAMVLWWIAILNVVILDLSVLYMIVLIPSGMVISGAISTRELVKYSTKNKLKPDNVMLVDLPNTAGILPCIIIQLIIIAICHYTQGILS